MRVVRINELIKREISDILHTRYRDVAVRITISGVDTAPNLQNATVYYGVIGEVKDRADARRFFAREGEEIRMQLSKRIVLKYLPHLAFSFDDSLERGARLNELMDSLEDGPSDSDTEERGDLA
ncbi:MAG: 30S ribosome-binding factor RbfA [Opitutales bacterium]|nr:30S ribosome-binding factor RbfA [Opitutales bacterium]